jgi:hypothetical protein
MAREAFRDAFEGDLTCETPVITGARFRAWIPPARVREEL